MITSYQVGAVFEIVDKASSTLKVIAAQFKELDALILRTKESMATFGSTGLSRLSTKVKALNEQLATLPANMDKSAGGMTAGFGLVNKEIDSTIAHVRALKTEMGSIAMGPRLPLGAGRPRISSGGGGSGGGEGGSSIGMRHNGPGGVYVRESGAANVAGLGILGGIGYGAYEEAKMQDAIFQLLYHTGLPDTKAAHDRFRAIIQNSMSESGFPLDSVIEASKTEARMFKGTPGNGVDVLPEMLRAATIEARLKGTSVQESMNSLIGLAHMTKEYDPEAIKKLAPAFAFLSASNPSSLGSMERAAGYAVPILQSGLEIDPMNSLLLGTVLTRAGITNTKSGTWLRNMALGAMPGSAFFTKTQVGAHNEALKSLGLVDNAGQPTWFTDGKPDLFKLLSIGGANAKDIPLADRAAIEKKAFGVQGQGAFDILANPVIREQVESLNKEMNSPEFKNRYATFSQQYAANSPMQQGRKAWADLQNVLMDIGGNVLPSVTLALGAFDSVLKGIKGTLGDNLGTKAITGGAVLGALSLTKSGRAALSWGSGAAATTATGALPYFAGMGAPVLAGVAASAGIAGSIMDHNSTAPDHRPWTWGRLWRNITTGQDDLPDFSKIKEQSSKAGQESGAALKDGFNPQSFQATGAAAAQSLLSGFQGAVGGGISKMSLVPPANSNHQSKNVVLKVNERVLGRVTEQSIVRGHSIPISTNSHDGAAAYSPVDAVSI